MKNTVRYSEFVVQGGGLYNGVRASSPFSYTVKIEPGIVYLL